MKKLFIFLGVVVVLALATPTEASHKQGDETKTYKTIKKVVHILDRSLNYDRYHHSKRYGHKKICFYGHYGRRCYNKKHAHGHSHYPYGHAYGHYKHKKHKYCKVY